MKIKGYTLLPIILLATILVVAFIYLQQIDKLPQKKHENYDRKADNYQPNLLTQDHELVNTKYNYSIKYSDIFKISTPNPETASSVNFRKKDDDKSNNSGVSIKVLESTSDLQSQCNTPLLEDQGIICTKDNLDYSPLLDSLPWKIYREGIIDAAPSGYVYSSMFNDGYIYLIVNYGYAPTEADVIMDNVRLIN